MKPHKGYLRDARMISCAGGYVYNGLFDGHPMFDGSRGNTSLVLREESPYSDGAFEVETLNSRYTIVLDKGRTYSGVNVLDTD